MKFHLIVLSLLPFATAQGNGQGGSGTVNPNYCSSPSLFLTERAAGSNLTSDQPVNCCLEGSTKNPGVCGDSSCTVFGFKNSRLAECTINNQCLLTVPDVSCNRKCVGDKSGREWTWYPYCDWEKPGCNQPDGNKQPSCWGYVKCESLNATVQVDSTDCYGYGHVCLGSGVSRNFKICLGNGNSTNSTDGTTGGEGGEDCGFCAPDNEGCTIETKKKIYDEGYYHKTIESCRDPDKLVAILNGYDGLLNKCRRSDIDGCNNIICDAFVEPEIRASIDAVVDCPAPPPDASG